MAFTVIRADGTMRDAEFEAYARLLRQRGIDLGRLPRVPEPGTRRRWLYVWDSRQDAEAFADELNRRTPDRWIVIETNGPPSDGPLGPITVQVGRRADGLVFGLHPLSRSIIESAFPEAKGSASTISVNFDTLDDFQAKHGGLENLAREVVPTLTGLSREDLEKLGYALIEDDTGRTLVFVPSGDLSEVVGSGSHR